MSLPARLPRKPTPDVKRLRGRPQTDDVLRLRRLARLIVEEKAPSLRSAMFMAMGCNDLNGLRRLQRKWKKVGAHFLEGIDHSKE